MLHRFCVVTLLERHLGEHGEQRTDGTVGLFAGHHGKALAGLSCPGRFNGGIQGQKIGLFRYFHDGFRYLANGLGRFT